MTDYDTKLEAACAELSQTSIWRSNQQPPILTLMRKIGLKPRPPHYATFATVSIGYAAWFGPAWGLLMWFVLWRSQGMPPIIAAVMSCIAGIMFGVLMAIYYARGRKKHNLSNWDDL